jgi:hypothetical protein
LCRHPRNKIAATLPTPATANPIGQTQLFLLTSVSCYHCTENTPVVL